MNWCLIPIATISLAALVAGVRGEVRFVERRDGYRSAPPIYRTTGLREDGADVVQGGVPGYCGIAHRAQQNQANVA